MKKTLGLVIILGLSALPTFAQSVTIDYAHDFDFDSVKTFQYVDTDESEPSKNMMADRIVNKIKECITAGGLTEVQSDGDIMVTSHVTSKENTVYNTTSFGYGGYGPGWGGWGYGGYGYGYGGGMGTATTTASTYEEGTLIIDAYNPDDKKMIWRGTGTVTVKKKPEKQLKQVDNILAKLGKKWKKILAGEGK